MMNRKMLWLVMVFLPLMAAGQTREVKGEYRYYADPNQSLKEAKAAAIESARIAALGKEFGTLISQDVLSQESNDDSYFMQLSTAEVKGEWIKDLMTPEAKIVDKASEDVIVIDAKVKGLARPIKNDAADFEAMTLRNGTGKQFASTEYVEGDKLYLYFKAPADGFVAAYMIDEKQQAFCLLPHESSNSGQQRVIHNKEYVFFSEKYDPDFNYGDGLRVTCEDDRLELNRIYVIYSPNPFVKPNDNGTKSLGRDNLVLPRQLKLADFSRWMSKVYASDKKMNRKVIRMRIKKNTNL